MGSFEITPTGTDAEVSSSGRRITRLPLAGKEAVVNIQTLRWEDVDLAHEQGVHLLCRPSNCSSSCDDLGANLLTIYLPR